MGNCTWSPLPATGRRMLLSSASKGCTKRYRSIQMSNSNNFYAEWNKDKAYEQTVGFLKRYPEIGAIWGANDPMALGAMAGVVAAGKSPGKDVFLGGLNWDPPALDKVTDGALVTPAGGR